MATGDNTQRVRSAAAMVFAVTATARAALAAEPVVTTSRARTQRIAAEAAWHDTVATETQRAAARVRHSAHRAVIAADALLQPPGPPLFVRVGELRITATPPVPLVLPLVGRGHLVLAAPAGEPRVREVIDSVVAQAAIEPLAISCFDPLNRDQLSGATRLDAAELHALVTAPTERIPGHLLVVLDYPHGLDVRTAAALAEFLCAGTGVSTLLHQDLTADPARELPESADIHQIRWCGDGFTWSGCPHARVELTASTSTAVPLGTPLFPATEEASYLAALADITATLDRRDAQLSAADHRLQSTVAALARHLLDQETRLRDHHRLVELRRAEAERLLRERGLAELVPRVEQMPSAPAGVSVAALVTAQDLALNELRRRLSARPEPLARESCPNSGREVGEIDLSGQDRASERRGFG